MSFFNISSGFTGCYKENTGSYNDTVDYTAPVDVWQNDATVLQSDFYSTDYYIEVPKSEYFDTWRVLGTGVDNPKFKAFTEFDFCLQDYTNIKNLVLEYQLDRSLYAPSVVSLEPHSIVRYRQSEYCFLDFIENIEVNLGSNKLTINSYMQDTISIKRWLQTMIKSDTDLKIAGKLGLSCNYPVNDEGFRYSREDIGLSEEIQKSEWKSLMDCQITDAQQGISSSVKVSVPLYMIVPFFNQELSYLPKDFPINIKINWKIDTKRSSNIPTGVFVPYTDSLPSWLFGSNFNTSAAKIDSFGGLNYILNGGPTIDNGLVSTNPKNGPVIKYMYSRLTKNRELDANLVMKNYTFNYYTFLLNEFSNSFGAQTYNLSAQTNCTVPLELMVCIHMDENALTWSTPYTTSTNPINVLEYKPLSAIDFRLGFISVRGNGSLIKQFGERVPDVTTTANSGTSMEESAWCIERLLAVQNNSDTTYQNTINNFGTSSNMSATPYQICLANGGLFKRMLRPNVDGFTNITIELLISNYNKPLDSKLFYRTRVYLKYLTQLLVDENFQVTLVNNPAISI